MFKIVNFLIVAGLIVFLFGPQLLRIWRALKGAKGGRGAAEPFQGNVHKSVKCPHCGEILPEGMRYCGKCGRPLDFIDV